jgi:c-di-GMP-specific phosphodiesterase
MALGSKDRFVWDTTVTLEALGAAQVVLWNWDPDADKLRFTGAARAMGLSPLAPECAAAAAFALCLPQDRHLMERALSRQEPGAEISARVRMRGGETCIWRGEWLEEGGPRASGVIVPASRFVASDKDLLTGLLDRRSFIAQARVLLRNPQSYTLVVADLDRLRRLNEALGHERADLVLAALGSRLAATFPPGAIMARVGEDEFAALVPCDIDRPAEIMRASLEQPLRIAGFDIVPTLSPPRRRSCCAGPNWPWKAPRPPDAAERRPMATPWKATACPVWPWNPICAALSGAARSCPITSPWSGCRPGPFPVSRPWPAGVTRAAA